MPYLLYCYTYSCAEKGKKRRVERETQRERERDVHQAMQLANDENNYEMNATHFRWVNVNYFCSFTITRKTVVFNSAVRYYRKITQIRQLGRFASLANKAKLPIHT